MFASVLLMRLTISTRCGWDFSKPSTEDCNPRTDNSRNSGLCSPRVASWAEIFAKLGDAFRLFAVRLGERAHLGFQASPAIEAIRACVHR